MPTGAIVVKPVVADYSSRQNNIVIPRSDLRPLSLCYAEFLPDQLLAVLQDPRIIVLESIHSSIPNYNVMTQQMSEYGLTSGMTTHDILLRMYTVMGNETGYVPEL